MAMHTKVERKLIEAFQVNYFGGFPVIGAVKYVSDQRGVQRLVKDLDAECWHNWVRERLVEYGYLITPFYNRRRFFYGRPEEDKTLREAIAYCPQSMTADAIDTGILRLWAWGQVQVLIQVHDSVLFQYPAEREAEIIPKAIELCTIQHELKRGRPFNVPADAKIGWNWADRIDDKTTGKITNPNGLIKWKGEPDPRPRPPMRTGRRTFEDLLDEA